MNKPIIKQLDKYLSIYSRAIADGNAPIDAQATERYLKNYRKLVDSSFRAITLSSKDSTNLLYLLRKYNLIIGLQLTWGIAVTDDLQEISRDFDSDTYPRNEYLIDKIKKGRYEVQKK